MLADVYPESQHGEKAVGRGATDDAIWASARSSGLLLVTKDEDFHRLSVLRGAPPKVIWLRLGNCTTDEVAGLLRRHAIDIEQFGGQVEITVLELG